MLGHGKIRVLVADNEPLMRRALVDVVNGAPDMIVVGEASTGCDAVSHYMELKPEVTLIDTRMLRADGSHAIAEINSADAAASILALSTSTSKWSAVAAVRAGASGFMFKHDDPGDLVGAIRAVRNGRYIFSPAASRDLIDFVCSIPPYYTEDKSDRLQLLSCREDAIVRLLVHGMSNSEISRNLHLSESTVKTHLSSVMNKWHARDRTQVVIFAIQSGYGSLLVPASADRV